MTSAVGEFHASAFQDVVIKPLEVGETRAGIFGHVALRRRDEGDGRHTSRLNGAVFVVHHMNVAAEIQIDDVAAVGLRDTLGVFGGGRCRGLNEYGFRLFLRPRFPLTLAFVLLTDFLRSRPDKDFGIPATNDFILGFVQIRRRRRRFDVFVVVVVLKQRFDFPIF